MANAVVPPGGPLTCISPHLDDGVLSCGQVLSRHHGATIVTIFAGIPPEPRPLTPWDQAAGFESAEAAMGARYAEDRSAARALAATVVHSPFLDAQYRAGAPPDEAVDWVAERLPAGPVLIPLGLFHDDHRATRSIALRALARRGGRLPFAFYEDCPYRAVEGGRLRDEAVARLRRHWPLRLRTVHTPGTAARKAAAVAAYRSQITALRTTAPEAMDDVRRPERYWVIDRDDAWL